MEKKVPLQPNGERWDYVSLCLATNEQLEEVMRLGVQPKLEDLVGWEFKGWNTSDFTQIVGIRKFKKGFYLADPNRGLSEGIDGYNVKPKQNGLGEEWIDLTDKKGNSIKHSFYKAYPVNINEIDNKYPNAILINYGAVKHSLFDPSWVLRDYVVQVYPDNKDLLLGKAYLALGSLRIFVSYFVLERSNKSSLA